jgi:hypothetical protein
MGVAHAHLDADPLMRRRACLFAEVCKWRAGQNADDPTWAVYLREPRAALTSGGTPAAPMQRAQRALMTAWWLYEK